MLEAGLPNLTGDLGRTQMTNPTGVFTGEEVDWNAEMSSGGTTVQYMVSMDASKQNPIYGNATTVQPPALTTNYLIKY